ncbi:Voltage-dependent calcium channel subunit alpha-2/delta-4 [Camelus dromedarius]|uniref:Voltage-dependent calcium channel subunit alpha-2/delta-4 n=1 Tax=Camelus dromedarius TaxID=9838 RepID=A0A5N4C662_CAMDR|nr:Voltage-dependent calcium channel subunit alpha-2/delta-4 [Camelus dromedarius]
MELLNPKTRHVTASVMGRFLGEVDGALVTQLLGMGCSATHKHKKQDVLQPCDTAYPVFVHQTAIQEANGIVECGACQKAFVLQQIPRSNLLLLVTDPTCACSVFPPVLQEATEENAQDCGGTSDISASPSLLLLPLCAWLLPPRLLR